MPFTGITFYARLFRTAVLCVTLLFPVATEASPTARDALEAMRRAAAFMADSVSTHGGYVDLYTPDLSKRWGEVPARRSQIWCQPPGTPSMGSIFLECWRQTGDDAFREYAERAADALVWGQHPAGGWHYLIDFDMSGIEQWYEKTASAFWGWEEYYHYYGNCTFDDRATYAPAAFLLELYMETLDPSYRAPLLKALDFVMEAQYTSGGWPQRYPLMYEYSHDGIDDYTHYATFNDGVIRNNIALLFDAWEQLGDERYRTAAVRGMDFYILSQLPSPLCGWAQQYTMDMKPAQARTYEPAAVSAHRTFSNINDLMRFYTMTGDRRYLEPIPKAIGWLESARITDDPSAGHTHTGFYHPETGRPIYYHFEGTNPGNHHWWANGNRDGAWWYRKSARFDLDALGGEYEHIYALSPEEALAEYAASKTSAGTHDAAPDAEEVERIIGSLDSRGAWITQISVRQFDKGMLDAPTLKMDGIDTRVFIANMRTLAAYVAECSRK